MGVFIAGESLDPLLHVPGVVEVLLDALFVLALHHFAASHQGLTCYSLRLLIS